MKNSRLIIILLACLTLIFCLGSLFLYVVGSKEKSMRYVAEDKLQATVREKRKIENSLIRLREENQTLSETLTIKIDEIKAAQNTLVQTQTIKDMYYTELQTALKEAEDLRGSLDEEVTSKQTLLQEKEFLESQYEKMKSYMNKIVAAKTKLESKLEDVMRESRVQLGDIIVAPAGEDLSGGGFPDYSGFKVLLVNPKYNFVILDIGKEDDIALDTYLNIFRDKVAIAEIVVDKLYENMSSARIISVKEGERIHVGDNLAAHRLSNSSLR